MLLWALNPDNPYGYYILLRWACCAIFAYLTLQAVTHEQKGWGWILGIIAVVYNPILRVHLTREIWSSVNVATIVVAVTSVFTLKTDYGTLGSTVLLPVNPPKTGGCPNCGFSYGWQDGICEHCKHGADV